MPARKVLISSLQALAPAQATGERTNLSRSVPRALEGNHAPDFITIRHEPKAGCVLVTMHMTSGQVLTRLLKLDPAWTLEEMWKKGQRTWGETDSLGMTQEEIVLGNALSKLALNVCLIATAYGVRSLGPSNPSHLERLKRYAKLARKRSQEVDKADLDVRMGLNVEYLHERRTASTCTPFPGARWSRHCSVNRSLAAN